MYTAPRSTLARFLAPLLVMCGLLLAPLSDAKAQEGITEAPLVFYSAITATTPQIPFWAAVEKGWPGERGLDVQYWKNLDDLRGVILAGKGDIWLGHLEGFAQAAKRGAPITLIAVSGWKKFFFLTMDENVEDVPALAAQLAATKTALTVIPADGPSIGVLEKLADAGGPAFTLNLSAPQQAMLELMRGSISHMVAPEPIVTTLLEKKPGLRRLGSLEDVYAAQFGGPARLPLVGLAVRTALIKEEPEMIRALIESMVAESRRLAENPAAGIALLPEVVRNQVGLDLIEKSLPYDLILTVPANEAAEEVMEFLRMVTPQNAEGLPDSFLLSEDLFFGTL